MNNFQSFVVKYDMLTGIFMSLLLGWLFSFKYACIFMVGIIIGGINFIWIINSTKKWLGENQVLFLLSSVVRILLTIIIALVLRKDVVMIIFYISGIIVEQFIRLFCSYKWKGSV